MNLYLLTHTNDNDFNMDFIVQETSPERAIEAWRNAWIENELINDTYFDGKFEQGMPPGADVHEVLQVFKVEPEQGVAGVLRFRFWPPENDTPGGCNLLGYVNP